MNPQFWSDVPRTKTEKELGRICQKTGRIWFRLKTKNGIHVCKPDGTYGITYDKAATALEEETNKFQKLKKA